jgi:hypothetical protein
MRRVKGLRYYAVVGVQSSDITNNSPLHQQPIFILVGQTLTFVLLVLATEISKHRILEHQQRGKQPLTPTTDLYTGRVNPDIRVVGVNY